MKKVNELLSRAPLVTGLLISLGILKYIIFYKLFYIPITEYIQLSEILLLFTEDIIYILLFLLLPRLVSHFEELVNAEKQKIKMLQENNPEQAWRKQVAEFTKSRNVLLIFLWLCFIAMIVSALYGGRFQRTQALYGSACIIVGILTIYWERSLLKQNIGYHLRQYLYFLLLFAFLLFTVSTRAVSEAEQVHNGQLLGTTIITADSTYVSDSIHFYIGRTSQYTYIYNKQDKSSTILPNSEIKRISLKTKVPR